jgi:hypothetical protein
MRRHGEAGVWGLTRVNFYDMTRVSYTPKPPIWKTSPRISFMHHGSIPDVWTSQKNEVPTWEGVRSDDPRIDCKIGRVNLKIVLNLVLVHTGCITVRPGCRYVNNCSYLITPTRVLPFALITEYWGVDWFWGWKLAPSPSLEIVTRFDGPEPSPAFLLQ